MTPTIREQIQGFVIPNGDTALALVRRLEDNTVASFLTPWTKLQQEYDRDPPYDPQKLKDANMSYRVNVNTGEMEAKIDEATAVATETVFSPSVLIDPRIQTSMPTAATSVDRYQEIVAEEYTDLLWEELGIFEFVDEAHKDTMLNGFSAAVWTHKYDWRPVQPGLDRFRFPTDCPLTGDQVPLFGMRRGICVKDLFESMKNADWNEKLLKRALLDHFEKGAQIESTTTMTERFARLTAQWDRGDARLHSDAMTEVPVIDLFCSDPVTKKVTHMIVWEGPTDKEASEEMKDRAEQEVAAIAESLEEGHLLYVKRDKYECMKDVLWMMTYNKGRGTLETVKGLGARIYSHCAFSSRLFCQTADGAIQAATVVLQPPDGDQHAKIPMTRIGMYTALSPGWQIPQGTFNPPINHLISLRAMSSSIMSNNVGDYRRRSENPLIRETEKSATEVQAEQVYENESEQGRSMYRFRAWDTFHQTVFRKMVNEAYLFSGFTGEEVGDKVTALGKWMRDKFEDGAHPDDEDFLDDLPGTKFPGRGAVVKFLARCLLRNVPIEVIVMGRWKIKANRGVGAASRAARVNALTQVRSMAQDLPPDRRRIVARLLAGELANNSRFADRMFPDLETGAFVSQTVSLIAIENAMFRKGEYIPPAEDQPHVQHIEGVLTEAGNLLAQWQERGRDPQMLAMIADFFEIGARHAQGHVQFLTADPFFKDQARGFAEEISKMMRTAGSLRQMADQLLMEQQKQLQALQQENAQLRQQVESGMADAQVKIRQAELDHQIEVMDQESLNQSRLAKTQAAQQAQNIKTLQSEARAAEKHAAEMQRKYEEMNAERQKLQLELQKLQSKQG